MDPTSQPDPSSVCPDASRLPQIMRQTGSLGESHPPVPDISRPKRRPLWRRRWAIGLFVLFVLLAIGGITGAITGTFAFSLVGTVTSATTIHFDYDLHCPPNSTSCTLTLTRASSSEGPFNWKVTSSPPIRFAPSSGTLQPGQSVAISFTLPTANSCAATITVTDTDSGDSKDIKVSQCP